MSIQADLPDNPQWEVVPKGTPSASCRWAPCTATVYWIERKSRQRGKEHQTVRVPVDCDVEGGSSPDSLTPGRGVNHYQTCDGVRQRGLERE